MGKPAKENVWALVLAGGDGTRLQGFTRLLTGAPIPKQYCRILGGGSLLQATIARARLFAAPERILAIANRDHLDLARSQLSDLNEASIVVQPCNRDTGPGMITALLELERRDPAATVVVLPSDHFIGDEIVFAATIERMLAAVEGRPDKIALLGIRPEYPDPGFGYIVPAARRAVARVEHFEEKPSAARAGEIIERGALWSSFIMAFRVERLLALLRRSRPRELAAIESLPATGGRRNAAYANLEPWNFSRDFLEPNADQLLVVRGEDCGWSDWGTPQAIERTVLALGLNPPWLGLLTAASSAPQRAAAAA